VWPSMSAACGTAEVPTPRRGRGSA
jgi:hypothetical protein